MRRRTNNLKRINTCTSWNHLVGPDLLSFDTEKGETYRKEAVDNSIQKRMALHGSKFIGGLRLSYMMLFTGNSAQGGYYLRRRKSPAAGSNLLDCCTTEGLRRCCCCNYRQTFRNWRHKLTNGDDEDCRPWRQIQNWIWAFQIKISVDYFNWFSQSNLEAFFVYLLQSYIGP